MSEEQTFIELPERNNLYEVDEELEEGAKLCEKFLLLPDRYKDRETKVRLMLRNKFLWLDAQRRVGCFAGIDGWGYCFS